MKNAFNPFILKNIPNPLSETSKLFILKTKLSNRLWKIPSTRLVPTRLFRWQPVNI